MAVLVDRRVAAASWPIAAEDLEQLAERLLEADRRSAVPWSEGDLTVWARSGARAAARVRGRSTAVLVRRRLRRRDVGRGQLGPRRWRARVARGRAARVGDLGARIRGVASR